MELTNKEKIAAIVGRLLKEGSEEDAALMLAALTCAIQAGNKICKMKSENESVKVKAKFHCTFEVDNGHIDA